MTRSGWRILGVVGLSATLLGACAPYGDGAYEARKHRQEVERRTHGMRLATQQTERGQDLAGEALVQALSDKTLVKRFETFPNGKRGDYVSYTYYRAGGEYVLIDNWIQPRWEADNPDRWTVEGARLCVMDEGWSSTPRCYRVARAADGALQFYVDDPEEPYDTLLTSVVREVLDGPPPGVEAPAR